MNKFIMYKDQSTYGTLTLIRWYFIITGVVDGFSRLPVALDSGNNNAVLNCKLRSTKSSSIRQRNRKYVGSCLYD